MSSDLPAISYPVLLWREGYIYLATTPLELCVHSRSMFADTVRQTRAREWRLVDADGRYFDVLDWSSIRPFGGIKGIALSLFGSVFAVPVLANETKLSLPEFKKILASAIRSRYRYDGDKAVAVQVTKKLKRADSYKAAIDALPKL